MRIVRLLFCFLAVLGTSSAYTTKKREQRRPAFKASSVTKEETTAPTSNAAPAPSGLPVAFAPAVAYAYAHAHAHASYHEDSLDDEELIGYTTAFISCFLSLAIGFGLGYGT
jgi:hypothetical protein